MSDVEELVIGADAPPSDAHDAPPADPAPVEFDTTPRGRGRGRAGSAPRTPRPSDARRAEERKAKRDAGSSTASGGASGHAARVRQLHQTVAAVVIGVTMTQPQALRPTDREIDGICLPLESIYVRHAVVLPVSPDAADLARAGWAGLNYLMRVGIVPDLSRLLSWLFARRPRPAPVGAAPRGVGTGPARGAAPTGASASGGDVPLTTPVGVNDPLARLYTETLDTVDASR